MPWVSVVGSIAGGLISSSGSKKAAQAQTQAADQAIGEQRRQYDQVRTDLSPFREIGVAANDRLSQLMGLSGGRSGIGTPEYQSIYDRMWAQQDAGHRAAFGGMPLAESPNTAGVQGARDNVARAAEQEYRAAHANDPQGPQGSSDDPFAFDQFYQSGLKFGLDQGLGGVNARAIAGGGYDSGATIKALTRYANDYGSTKANDVYNRLAGLSTTGQNAAARTGAAGQNMANQVSGSLADAGNARAAGIVGETNAWNQAFGGIVNAIPRTKATQPTGSGSWYATNDPYNYTMGQNTGGAYTGGPYGTGVGGTPPYSSTGGSFGRDMWGNLTSPYGFTPPISPK